MLTLTRLETGTYIVTDGTTLIYGQADTVSRYLIAIGVEDESVWALIEQDDEIIHTSSVQVRLDLVS